MRIKGQSFGLLTMLAIQFILGMILNLFVTIPKVHPGQSGNFGSRSIHGFGWAITNGGGITLLLHVIMAILLLIASLSLVIRTISAKSSFWVGVSAFGAIGVIVALTNGLAFIGYDSDATSFVMAMGFITAAAAYSTGLAWSSMHTTQKSVKMGAKQPLHRRHGRAILSH